MERPPAARSQSTLAAAKQAAKKANLTPLKAAGLGVVVIGAIVLGIVLYPRFPRVNAVYEGAAADAEGQAMLAELLKAHGGVEVFKSAPGYEIQLEDTWNKLFEAFSIWPGYSAKITALLAPSGTAYKSRLSFADGSLWGHTGDRTWVLEGGVGRYDSLGAIKARYASWAVARMLLLPFSITHENAAVKAVARAGASGEKQDILSVSFPSPSYPSRRDKWLLFMDPDTHHVLRVVYESSASEPPIIESCVIEERQMYGALKLPSKVTCNMANSVSWALHQIKVSAVKPLPEVSELSFQPPGPHPTGTSTAAHHAPLPQ